MFMKNRKLSGQLLALILVCVMIIGTFAACNNTNGKTETDKTGLQSEITSSEALKSGADYSGYTLASRTAFENALTAAKAVNLSDDATQSEIDAAKNSLVTARNNLSVDTGSGEIPEADQYAGQLMIWQAGVSTNGAITRNFIELYNNSGDDISLSGYSIQYAGGSGTDWNVILLSGTVNKHTSFLVLGAEGDESPDSRLYFEDSDGDLLAGFVLSNNQYKICLINSTEEITAANPFDTDGKGSVAAGYVDLAGAVNGTSIDAYEGNGPAPKMSKQQAVRRTSLSDTNDNSVDFVNIDYRTSGLSELATEAYRPKNQAYGPWNPVTFDKLDSVTFEPFTDKDGLDAQIAEAEGMVAAAQYEAQYTEASRDNLNAALDAAKAVNDNPSATQYEINTAIAGLVSAVNNLIPKDEKDYAGLLMIWQAGAAKDGAIGQNFIELYNNSGDDIDLSGYSIQYANASGESNWGKIELTGKIEAHTSFLILGKAGTASDSRLSFAEGEGDMYIANFELSNDQYKICLIRSTVTLNVANPFNIDGEGTKAAGYVDLVGAVNGKTIDAFEETCVSKMSKQQSIRRAGLSDTDNNNTDFENVDYRTADLENYRPKNQAYGAWNPVTFEML